MSEQDWQGLDAEAGALLEALGCDTGRGEHEETAAALRRAFEAGGREAIDALVREMQVRYQAAAMCLQRDAADTWANAIHAARALPLPSPEREEPGR